MVTDFYEPTSLMDLLQAAFEEGYSEGWDDSTFDKAAWNNTSLLKDG